MVPLSLMWLTEIQNDYGHYAKLVWLNELEYKLINIA